MNRTEADRLPDVMLFDLDDTIVDYSHHSRESWMEACTEHCHGGQPCDPRTLFDAIIAASIGYWDDEERFRIGRNNLDQARRDVVRLAFDRLSIDNHDTADAIGTTYSRKRDAAYCLLPGARETLQAIHHRGVPMGLITNGGSAMQRRKIKRFDLEQYFDLIIVEGEFGTGKPDPAVYRHALAHFGVHAENTCMIGDNLEWDVAAPQGLGICGIWNDYRGTGLPPNSPITPDRVVTSIAQLLNPGFFATE